jgi:hypothetical protein
VVVDVRILEVVGEPTNVPFESNDRILYGPIWKPPTWSVVWNVLPDVCPTNVPFSKILFVQHTAPVVLAPGVQETIACAVVDVDDGSNTPMVDGTLNRITACDGARAAAAAGRTAPTRASRMRITDPLRMGRRTLITPPRRDGSRASLPSVDRPYNLSPLHPDG